MLDLITVIKGKLKFIITLKGKCTLRLKVTMKYYVDFQKNPNKIIYKNNFYMHLKKYVNGFNKLQCK